MKKPQRKSNFLDSMCEADKKVLYEKGDPLLKELTCAVVFSEEEFSGLISQSDTLA